MMKPMTRILPLLTIAMFLPAVAQADSVKVGGFWVDNVTIQQIGNGTLTYTTDIGGERIQPLARIEGIKSQFYPDITAGQAALEAKDDAKALRHFSRVAATARDPWAKHWAAWHKYKLLDKNGTPIEALRAYLDMVKDKAEPFYLAMPPIVALKRAKPGQVRDLTSRIEKARSSARGRADEQFKMMLDVLKLQAPAATNGTAAGTDAKEPMPAPRTAAAPKLQTTTDTGDSAVPLPSFMDVNDAITAMLRGGRFREAIETVDGRLAKKEPKMAMRLYQKGVAQLHQALKNDDMKLLKDSGLSFMRVIVYFGKSSYKGPALIEIGLVHEKIGDHEKAVELWRKARIELDPETDAVLVKRLDDLMGLEAGETEPTQEG